jgi:hypothetical protein
MTTPDSELLRLLASLAIDNPATPREARWRLVELVRQLSAPEPKPLRSEPHSDVLRRMREAGAL